jgi:LRRFIP family
MKMLCQAEARLAARQQARYEARNIRMRELEKKARDEEEGGGPASLPANHNSLHSGRAPLTNYRPLPYRYNVL